MTLGEYISKYMDSHGLSQRQFALKCNVTNGYVSMLISGVNPRTGKTLRPTLDTYVKLADGMGIPLNDLFKAVDDTPVSLPTDDDELWQMREEMRRNPELRTLYDLQRKATKSELKQMTAFIKAIRSNGHEDDPA